MSAEVQIVDHPMVQHKLTLLRQTETGTKNFREYLREIGWFLGMESLKDLPLTDKAIETPVAPMTGKEIAGKKLALISILRAGDGLLAPLLDIVPTAKIGQIGLARNEETLQPYKYSFKMPERMDQRLAVVIDPMLATGGSAIYAVNALKEIGVKKIKFICLVAAPEGVKALSDAHPDVQITTAAVDDRLTDIGYITPGLGDAGDRIFGTNL
ncbi:uracil phosphoribosyltransferase [Temperatibacter marinus]|uniref:Uracil phosphoribosyltransferase n=1 Tax=Temperatibacter marinus TaxID=1456591 RepID=A0AA52H8D2_9PROT|nr:uracil phosphoribosyltransferase [Temperatibacter marinus]WND01719.1 uracil phosphoribosyltransferase [Temperatibacter marinus]